MRKEILFRADGSKALGLGHVMRCLSLASILKYNFSISFYLKDADQSLIEIIKDKGFLVKSIKREKAFIDDVNKHTIVVLDGYHFDSIYQSEIKMRGAILICIDDLHNTHFFADIIINPAPGTSKNLYDTEPYTQFCFGAEYALLRPSFLEQAVKVRKIQKTESALICFGGADAKNLTVPTLLTTLTFSDIRNIIVVTGSAYVYLSELKEILSKNRFIRHHHNIREQALVQDLLDVELAIVPASGILFEVLACRTPVVSGYYVDNQLGIYHGFKDNQVFYDAGNFESTQLKHALKLALSLDPNEMIKKQEAAVDGKSADRYNNIFKRLAA